MCHKMQIDHYFFFDAKSMESTRQIVDFRIHILPLSVKPFREVATE
jgi:hypothetical protein